MFSPPLEFSWRKLHSFFLNRRVAQRNIAMPYSREREHLLQQVKPWSDQIPPLFCFAVYAKQTQVRLFVALCSKSNIDIALMFAPVAHCQINKE